MRKYTTLYLTPPTLLEILALSLTNILPSLTNLHLSPKLLVEFLGFWDPNRTLKMGKVRHFKLGVQSDMIDQHIPKWDVFGTM